MNLTFSSYYLGWLGYCIIKKSLASGLQRPEFPGEVIINIKDLIHLVGVGLPQVAALIGNLRPSREGINPKTITGGDQPQDQHGRGSTPRPPRKEINQGWMRTQIKHFSYIKLFNLKVTLLHRHSYY